MGYWTQGKLGEAELLLKQALTIREEVLGARHPDTALSLNNLAYLYEAQEKLGKAEPLYERALAILKRILGPDHPYTLTVQNNYNDLLQQMNDNPE